MSEERVRYPSVFHVGLPRTGSTTLQNVLRADQRITLSSDRFFQTKSYFEQPPFNAPPTTAAVHSDETMLRTSSKSFNMTVTLAHIRDKVPDADIILTIREQRDWLISRYKYELDRETCALNINDWLLSPKGLDFTGLGRYDVVYSTLLQFFPRNRIHIFLYEQLADDYHSYFERLYKILGLDCQPGERSVVLNKSRHADVLYYRKHLNKLAIIRSSVFGYDTMVFRAQRKVLRALALGAERVLPKVGDDWCPWPGTPPFDAILRDFGRGNAALESATGLALSKYGYVTLPENGDPTP